MRSFTTLSIAAMLAAGSMAGAMAQTYTATGSIKATANGQGSYADSNPTAESNSNPTDAGFGSFGIVDFSGTTALTSSANVTSLTLTLNNYPGKYAQSGPVDVFLTSNTAPVSTATNFTYLGDSATDGIGTQLGTLVSLGQIQYNASEAKNTLDTYTLRLNSAAESLLASDLKAGDVQFAFGAPTGSTTSTGYDGTRYAAPTMTLNTAPPAVPEASTTASFGLLLVLGLGGVAVARRRKQA